MIYTLDKEIWDKEYKSDNHDDYIADFKYKFILRGFQINEGEFKQISQYEISEFLDNEKWEMDDKYKEFDSLGGIITDENHLLLYNPSNVYISNEVLN